MITDTHIIDEIFNLLLLLLKSEKRTFSVGKILKHINVNTTFICINAKTFGGTLQKNIQFLN